MTPASDTPCKYCGEALNGSTGSIGCKCHLLTPEVESMVNPRYATKARGFADPFEGYKRDSWKNILNVLDSKDMKGKTKLQKIKEIVLKCL